MLSLSLDRAHFDDTQVQFDDMQWERHASSLRPLGLAIQLLLGDATMATRMLRLSDHLTHAALLRTRPPCQPVRPPWGLCQIPKILGKKTKYNTLYKQTNKYIFNSSQKYWQNVNISRFTNKNEKQKEIIVI